MKPAQARAADGAARPYRYRTMTVHELDELARTCTIISWQAVHGDSYGLGVRVVVEYEEEPAE